MSNYERITDQKVADLIHDLMRNQTLVKVSTADKEFGKLTVITATRGEGLDMCFRIDPPEGLIPLLHQIEAPALHFEFASDDRLPHRFEAQLKEVTREVWLQCPEHIQRYQLRNNFRIKAPANAHAMGRMEDQTIRMPVENISLGGALCHCPNSAKPLIVKDQIMKNLDLFFSFGGESHLVTIERAVVRRLEGRTRPRYFGVAFEFVRVKQDVQKRLVQIIYGLHRDFLKNRLGGR
ncbi:MAG: hypothetical protein C4519_07565 [Desulfobacteraceae bacterium]|nr:MAG: hypothetical protein C4519_07565 [Desulfobacteraceae bacterium]